jgi:hypothetical protein
MSNIQKLREWVEDRVRTHGLEEIAFTPGSDGSVSIEEAAGVALALIKNWDKGVPATEA